MKSTAELVKYLREVNDLDGAMEQEAADRLESLDRQCKELLGAVIAEEQGHLKTMEEMYTRGEVIDQLRNENIELKCDLDKLRLDQRESAESLASLHVECERLDQENEQLKRRVRAGESKNLRDLEQENERLKKLLLGGYCVVW